MLPNPQETVRYVMVEKGKLDVERKQTIRKLKIEIQRKYCEY